MTSPPLTPPSLCGFPPFYGESLPEVFEQIMKADFDFPDPYWTEISTEAKDLISKLLVVGTSRFSITILHHLYRSKNISWWQIYQNQIFIEISWEIKRWRIWLDQIPRPDTPPSRLWNTPGSKNWVKTNFSTSRLVSQSLIRPEECRRPMWTRINRKICHCTCVSYRCRSIVRFYI